VSDEAERGRAALVSIDLTHPEGKGALWTVYEEEPDDAPHASPIAKAWALWESVKADWPTMHASVIANDRARNLQAAYRTSALLGTDYATELAQIEADALTEPAS
jgi:hypothetical protein